MIYFYYEFQTSVIRFKLVKLVISRLILKHGLKIAIQRKMEAKKNEVDNDVRNVSKNPKLSVFLIKRAGTLIYISSKFI